MNPHYDKAVIPVLMYHQVLEPGTGYDPPLHPYQISLRQFVEQLHFLKRANLTTVLVEHFLQAEHRYFFSSVKRSVALTFDDGYLDNYSHAYPALRKLNMNATFFVIVNKIGTPGFMAWEHLREMQAHGMSIQSHTMNHHALATLSPGEILSEVREARQRLEEELQKKITVISFPHGSYDTRVTKLVAATGYQAWCTSDFGYHKVSRRASRIPRIIVRPHHTLKSFRSMVSSSGARVLRLRAGAAVRRTIARTIGFKAYQFLYDRHYRKTHGLAASVEPS